MAEVGAAPRFVDAFGRIVRKLRISVTDRCNLRCVYCMPEDAAWLPKEEILTFEEIERVARVCVAYGVRKIRLTGGEPLARRGLEKLIERLAGIDGLQSLAMTTNAYYLRGRADALRQAGLQSLNISLDTLRPDRFALLARRGGFESVMDGIEAALEAGFPVKINMVVMKGFNDDEVPDFLRWGRRRGVVVRFIEFMPLDGDRIWNADLVATAEEILQAARKVADFEEAGGDGRDPARLYRYADGGGEFGIIASVSRPFCGACDRIRLTADGKIRNCLFANRETDLKPILRGGADDKELAGAIAADVAVKWAGHLINRPGFVQPERAMHAIGG